MNISRTLRFTLLFAVLAISLILLQVFAIRQANRTREDSLQLIRTAQAVKEYTSNAQRDAGRPGTDVAAQVIAPLTAASKLLQAAYDGHASSGAVRFGLDEDTRAMIKETIIALGDAAEKAREVSGNLSENETVKSIFRAPEEKVTRLSAHLNAIADERESRAAGVLWLAAAALFAGLGIAGLVQHRIHRKLSDSLEETSSKLSDESGRVEKLSGFIEAVSSGNYDIQLSKQSEDDSLTDMLINMRDKLRTNADDDRKRNWATTGLAQVGDILRGTSNSAELYDNIIRFMVKYTKSNQGGLFILNTDSETEKHLDLVSCYAFERKKFLNKKVGLGEGLVGQCFLEGERIYLLEVPQEYVSITSGLGGSNPNALLIVPMKVNDEIYGVIELASFRKYEPHEIELVEKLAESIASTISNVRVNETTRILLEKTQQQAEEMRSQEEEIRQNMEELEATQEEMRRKQTILEQELDQSQKQAEVLRIQEKRLTESQDTLQAIVDNIPRAIFWKDRDLKFMGCNRIFADVAGVSSPRDLIGKSDFDMAWSAQADAYRKDDMEVMRSRKAKLDIEEVNVNSEGEESWVKTSKVPIISTSGDVVAILGMFEDITAQKKKDADVAIRLKEREEALNELQALKQLLQVKKV